MRSDLENTTLVARNGITEQKEQPSKQRKKQQKKSLLMQTGSAIVLSDWIAALGFIFGGCCSNVFALESLVREVPKCGNLITFAQFIFITGVGLPSHLYVPEGKWLPRLQPRNVPLGRWIVMVGLYFLVSVLNNIALGYRISVPLHIVFRSSGLIANMICGYIVMHKKYPARQVVAVLMVSAGVVIATLSSISAPSSSASQPRQLGVGGIEDDTHFRDSIIGITLLTCGVFFAAMLGLYQETTYNMYGKHWREGLFYNHALALPMFLLFRQDILNQITELSASRPLSISALPVVGKCLASRAGGLTIPSLWVSLIANILSQLVCVTGVHRFTSMSSSLTLNVVLNLRKLISLAFSVLLFKNTITQSMIFGCGLVFFGTFAYTQTKRTPTPSMYEAKEVKYINPKQHHRVEDNSIKSSFLVSSRSQHISSARLNRVNKKAH